MLNILRRRARASARSPMIKALLLVIILVFVFWGVGGVTRSQQLETVATIDDHVISSQEFQRAYERSVAIVTSIRINSHPSSCRCLISKAGRLTS
jgi:peptidyl-prolyl cis-trans isomerase D